MCMLLYNLIAILIFAQFSPLITDMLSRLPSGRPGIVGVYNKLSTLAPKFGLVPEYKVYALSEEPISTSTTPAPEQEEFDIIAADEST